MHNWQLGDNIHKYLVYTPGMLRVLLTNTVFILFYCLLKELLRLEKTRTLRIPQDFQGLRTANAKSWP